MMTKRSNYPRLRNGRLEGSGLPPHFVDETNKEVVFHVPGGFPVVLAMNSWMKSFPGYKGSITRCEETFYKLRAKK